MAAQAGTRKLQRSGHNTILREQVHYVAAENTNPLPPYTSWATAPQLFYRLGVSQ